MTKLPLVVLSLSLGATSVSPIVKPKNVPEELEMVKYQLSYQEEEMMNYFEDVLLETDTYAADKAISDWVDGGCTAFPRNAADFTTAYNATSMREIKDATYRIIGLFQSELFYTAPRDLTKVVYYTTEMTACKTEFVNLLTAIKENNLTSANENILVVAKALNTGLTNVMYNGDYGALYDFYKECIIENDQTRRADLDLSYDSWYRLIKFYNTFCSTLRYEGICDLAEAAFGPRNTYFTNHGKDETLETLPVGELFKSELINDIFGYAFVENLANMRNCYYSIAPAKRNEAMIDTYDDLVTACSDYAALLNGFGQYNYTLICQAGKQLLIDTDDCYDIEWNENIDDLAYKKNQYKTFLCRLAHYGDYFEILPIDKQRKLLSSLQRADSVTTLDEYMSLMETIMDMGCSIVNDASGITCYKAFGENLFDGIGYEVDVIVSPVGGSNFTAINSTYEVPPIIVPFNVTFFNRKTIKYCSELDETILSFKRDLSKAKNIKVFRNDNGTFVELKTTDTNVSDTEYFESDASGITLFGNDFGDFYLAYNTIGDVIKIPTPQTGLTYVLYDLTAKTNVTATKEEGGKNIYETTEGHSYTVKYTLSEGYVFENANADIQINNLNGDYSVTLPKYKAINHCSVTIPAPGEGLTYKVLDATTNEFLNPTSTGAGNVYSITQGHNLLVVYSAGSGYNLTNASDAVKTGIINSDETVTLPQVAKIAAPENPTPAGDDNKKEEPKSEEPKAEEPTKEVEPTESSSKGATIFFIIGGTFAILCGIGFIVVGFILGKNRKKEDK